MSMVDIVLRFVYPHTVSGSGSDIRTFNVYQVFEDPDNHLELYKFYHPATGLNIGTTTFHRKNMATLIWDPAGQIEWSSNFNATVAFGVDTAHIRELRKSKNLTSRSRRFKVGDTEYKWKISPNQVDLFCVDTYGNKVATWQQEALILVVAAGAENILDRIVVTCMLNLWVRQLGRW